MAKNPSIRNAFNPSRRIRATGKGYAGFDNPRENIDPHIKTKVVSSLEGSVEKVPVNNNDIVNKAYVDGRVKYKQWNFTILDPAGVYDIDPNIFIAHVFVDIVITELHVELDVTTNQVAGDLVHWPNFISSPTATVINDFDTTAGVRTDNSISNGNVSAGRHVGLKFDSQPDAAIKQMHVTIFYEEV